MLNVMLNIIPLFFGTCPGNFYTRIIQGITQEERSNNKEKSDENIASQYAAKCKQTGGNNLNCKRPEA